MKKNKFFILFSLIIFFLACKNEKILPNNFELNKVKSFYSGIYKTEIFILENKISSLENLKEFPVYNNKLEGDVKSYNWELLNIDSDIFNSLIYNLNSSLGITKNDTDKKWIEALLFELKDKKEKFYIAGVYSKIAINQSDFNYNFYNYYLLNFKKSKFIKLTNDGCRTECAKKTLELEKKPRVCCRGFTPEAHRFIAARSATWSVL